MAEPDQGGPGEGEEEEPVAFWTISSKSASMLNVECPGLQLLTLGSRTPTTGFRVQVQGNVAIASDSFKVATRKAGDAQEAGEARREQSVASAVSADARSAGTTRVLEHDDQPFPWELATAVSDKVFEDGIHEFVVEVGGPGLLGFCPASFVEQRTRIGKHWMNEDNVDRTWTLHSTGAFANGNMCSESERNARFTAGDRILVRLNLFQVLCKVPGSNSNFMIDHAFFISSSELRIYTQGAPFDPHACCNDLAWLHWDTTRPVTQETAEYFRSPFAHSVDRGGGSPHSFWLALSVETPEAAAEEVSPD